MLGTMCLVACAPTEADLNSAAGKQSPWPFEVKPILTETKSEVVQLAEKAAQQQIEECLGVPNDADFVIYPLAGGVAGAATGYGASLGLPSITTFVGRHVDVRWLENLSNPRLAKLRQERANLLEIFNRGEEKLNKETPNTRDYDFQRQHNEDLNKQIDEINQKIKTEQSKSPSQGCANQKLTAALTLGAAAGAAGWQLYSLHRQRSEATLCVLKQEGLE